MQSESGPIHTATPALARSATPTSVWIAIIGALLYCPAVTILFRLELIDQPASGLLAAASVLTVALLSFPQLASKHSLGVGLLRDWAGLALCCFAAATALSTTLAQFGDRAHVADIMWRQYAMAFIPLLLFFVSRELARRPTSHKPIATALGALAVVTVASVSLYVSGVLAFESYGSRRFGILGDAAAWTLSAFVVVSFAGRRWLLLVLCLACLLATASRAPIAIAILGVLVHALLRPGRTLAAAKLRAAIVVGVAVAVYFADRFLPSVAERFFQTDLFSNDRVDTSSFSWEVFLQDPLVGRGYNSHSYYFAQVFGEPQEGSTVYSVPTSTIAQSLADSGLLGAFFLCAALAALLVASFRVVTGNQPKSILQHRTTDFPLIAQGLAAWLIAFIPINQTAGYVLPNSQLGAFFFCAAGIVIGYARPLSRRRVVAHHLPPNPASTIRGVSISTSRSSTSE